MPEQNGNPAALELGPHDIVVRFNPENQTVGIIFQSQVFKTWGFVGAVLAMAEQYAEALYKMSIASELQQKQMQANQEMALRQQFLKGR